MFVDQTLLFTCVQKSKCELVAGGTMRRGPDLRAESRQSSNLRTGGEIAGAADGGVFRFRLPLIRDDAREVTQTTGE
jgi:hypothetical protein